MQSESLYAGGAPAQANRPEPLRQVFRRAQLFARGHFAPQLVEDVFKHEDPRDLAWAPRIRREIPPALRARAILVAP